MHFKENNKERRTYVQGLRPFGNALPKAVKGILKKNGYNFSEIVSKWNILLDKNISEFSYPKSIKISKSNGNCTLIVSVKRGNELTIEYSKEEIIRKINSYFGYKLIKNIKLVTYNNKTTNSLKKNDNINSFSKKFDKEINKIKNEKIRKSLSNLLDAIKK